MCIYNEQWNFATTLSVKSTVLSYRPFLQSIKGAFISARAKGVQVLLSCLFQSELCNSFVVTQRTHVKKRACNDNIM